MTVGLTLSFDAALMSPTVTTLGANSFANAPGVTNEFWEQMTPTTVGDCFAEQQGAIEPDMAQTVAAFVR